MAPVEACSSGDDLLNFAAPSADKQWTRWNGRTRPTDIKGVEKYAKIQGQTIKNALARLETQE